MTVEIKNGAVYFDGTEVGFAGKIMYAEESRFKAPERITYRDVLKELNAFPNTGTPVPTDDGAAAAELVAPSQAEQERRYFMDEDTDNTRRPLAQMPRQLGPSGRVMSSFPQYMNTLDYPNGPERIAARLMELVDEMEEPPDTLVGTGMSGACIVPYAAEMIGLHWGLVRRKSDTNSHSQDRCNYVGKLGSRWMFVDDLIASGNTRRHVMKVVTEACTGQQTVSLYKRPGSSPDLNIKRTFSAVLPPAHDTEFVGSYFYENGVFVAESLTLAEQIAADEEKFSEQYKAF